jgi:hypothetical protein
MQLNCVAHLALFYWADPSSPYRGMRRDAHVSLRSKDYKGFGAKTTSVRLGTFLTRFSSHHGIGNQALRSTLISAFF